MKTKIIFCSIFLSQYVFAQLNLTWIKALDVNIGFTTTKIVVDKANNIIISGWFSSTIDFDPGIGTANLTPSGSPDAFIAKYDNNGNYVWAKKIGGNSSQVYNNNLITDSLNNFYITGRCTGNGTSVDFDPGAGTFNINIPGSGGSPSSKIYLAKYDGNGNYLWAKDTTIGNQEEGAAIFLDNNYDVIVGGGGFPGMAFLTKYSNNGSVIFLKTFLGPSSTVKSALTNSSNEILISGTVSGPIDIDPGPGTQYIGNGTNDMFLAKYSSNGSLIWGNACGIFVGVNADLAIDNLNNLYLAGSEGTTRKVHISKWDNSGNPIWLSPFGGNAGLLSNGIKLSFDCSNNLKLFGYFQDGCVTNSRFDFDPSPNTLTLSCPISYANPGDLCNQIYFADINMSNGAVTSVKNIGGAIYSNPSVGLTNYFTPNMFIDKVNNIYFVGTIGSLSSSTTSQFDFNGGAGIVSTSSKQGFITKYNGCSIAGIEEQLSNDFNIKIYPNPSENIIYVGSESETIKKCLVFDLLGHLVIETSDTKICTDNLQKGQYILRIFFGNNNCSKNFKVFKS